MRYLIPGLATAMACLVLLACGKDESFYQVYGETNSSSCIVRLTDGGLLLACFEMSSRGVDSHGTILRLDRSGRERAKWSPDNISEVISMREGPDGGAVVLCNVWEELLESDLALVALDSDGGLLWRTDYSEMPSSSGLCLVGTADNGFLALGSAGRFESRTGLLVKFSGEGGITWSQTYGSGVNSFFRDAVETDEGYLVLGVSQEDGNVSTPWVLSIDGEGEVLASSILDLGSEATATAIAETGQGYALLVCLYSGTRIDPAIVFIGDDLQMTEIVNLGAANLIEYPSDLLVTDDGNLVALCSRFDETQNRSGILVVETTEYGSLLRQRELNLSSGHLIPYGLTTMPDGSILVCGRVGYTGDLSRDQAFLLKTDEDWNVEIPNN